MSLRGKGGFLWGIFQPVSSICLAVTAVPCPASSVPIVAGGREWKNVCRKEEGPGCWRIWTSSPRLTARVFAVHEALLVAGDGSGFARVLLCHTWRC